MATIPARHLELALLATQFEVRARNLCGHQNLRVPQIGLRALRIGGRGFDSAANTAEEIQLPDRIELRLVNLELPPGTAARCAPG